MLVPVGEDIQQILGQLRLEQPVGERPVGRRTGHGQIARHGGGRVLAQLGDMCGDGARVAARHGAGERGVAGAQRVVEGGAQERAEHPGGSRDPGLAQQLHRLGDQRDQMVRTERQRRVVERAEVLLDPLGLAAHLDDQRLGGQAQFVGSCDSEGAAREPLDVHGGARERHRGVQRERQRARAQGGRQHLRAVPPRGVDQQLSQAYGSGLGEPFDQAGQRVVRNGQQHQFGAGEHLGGRHEGHVGEQDGRPAYGGVGDARRGDRAVSGEPQSGGQRRSDTAGTHDSDREPGGPVPRVTGIHGNC